ncbi:MAG: hypothetical protein JO103_12805, partial [Candidatus Eremiobacteraeota bacterium]|nr:hypothetical protein [Candidatus Eremiobacteraeota bacterium]
RDRSAVPDLDGYLARPARAASGLSESNRVLVERFLARAATLDPQARMRVAGQIADHVRPTLTDPRRDLDDEALLEYLAAN